MGVMIFDQELHVFGTFRTFILNKLMYTRFEKLYITQRNGKRVNTVKTEVQK